MTIARPDDLASSVSNHSPIGWVYVDIRSTPSRVVSSHQGTAQVERSMSFWGPGIPTPILWSMKPARRWALVVADADIGRQNREFTGQ